MYSNKEYNLQRVGAIFDAESKKGTKYFNIKLFDAELKIMAFKKTAKESGKEYYEIVVGKENLEKDLEALQLAISKFLEKQNNEK